MNVSTYLRPWIEENCDISTMQASDFSNEVDEELDHFLSRGLMVDGSQNSVPFKRNDMLSANNLKYLQRIRSGSFKTGNCLDHSVVEVRWPWVVWPFQSFHAILQGHQLRTGTGIIVIPYVYSGPQRASAAAVERPYLHEISWRQSLDQRNR